MTPYNNPHTTNKELSPGQVDLFSIYGHRFNTTPGFKHELYIEVDYENKVHESNENNNKIARRDCHP